MKECKYCGLPIKFIQRDSDAGWYCCDTERTYFDDCEVEETLVLNDGTEFTVDPNKKYPQDSAFGYRKHRCQDYSSRLNND